MVRAVQLLQFTSIRVLGTIITTAQASSVESESTFSMFGYLISEHSSIVLLSSEIKFPEIEEAPSMMLSDASICVFVCVG